MSLGENPGNLMSDDLGDMIGRRYTRFMQRVRADEGHEAGEEFSKLLAMMRRHDLRPSPRLLSGMTESFIDLFWQMRRHDLMLQAAEDAIQVIGPDPEWSFARGEALFYLCRFPEAREVLEQLTTEDFEEPMVYYLLACLAERRGDQDQAERLFQSANRLDPKGFHLPKQISEEEARQQYEACLSELPETIQFQIRDVPIFIDGLPSDALLKQAAPVADPLILGLFMGQPRGAEESPWADDQPRILLFHQNIAKLGGDLEAVEEELRKTLFHEVGHYLGFDEDDLEEMGLA